MIAQLCRGEPDSSGGLMLSMHANIQATGWPILPAGEIVEMLQQTGAHRRAVRR
jgi:hypothetical protein